MRLNVMGNTNKNQMKKEWKPLVISGLISVLTIGLMTSFKYNDVDIQLHDRYFIIDAVRGCIYLTAIIFTLRNIYLLLDFITGRYMILAVFVAIVNPLVALFIIIFIYFNVAFVGMQLDVGINAVASSVLTGLMIGIIILQIAIEVKVLRKLRQLIA